MAEISKIKTIDGTVYHLKDTRLPAYNDNTAEFLRGDGEWASPTVTTMSGNVTVTDEDTYMVIEPDTSGSVSLQAKTNINPTTSSQTITPDSGYDGLSSVQINAMASGSAATPATTVTANPSISVSEAGIITASVSTTKSVTPTVTAGYVSSGTAGTITVSGSNTSQLSTQGAATITPTTSQQTAVAAGKYTTGAVVVSAVATGTAGTPTATKGTVSNHSISVTPSVTNTTGYITGSTKTGTAVTVNASELVSGSETKTSNGTYDVTNLAELVVDVPSKNVQISNTQVRLSNKTALTNTGLTLTVSVTGTYNVYWSAFRTNTSSGYTWGTQLYIGSTAYGSENTSWSNSYNQINKLTGVSLTKNQVLNIYGRTRSGNSYYVCCSNLILEQTA